MTSYIKEKKTTSENITPDNRSHNKNNFNTGEIKKNGIGANNKRLNDRHWHNATVTRGLDPEWVKANCYSGDQKEVSEVLHVQAKSGGIIFDANQVQVRPDKPWGDGKGKKAPKYRTPYQDDYDAILPINPNDPTYWTDINKLKEQAYKIDGVPCLFVTEGGWKAIAGCSNDLPTIGLCGVEMGLIGSKHDPEGKRYLIPSLRQYADHGFGFIFAFDADCATNKNVILAEKKLAYQLEKMGVPAYSITGTWSQDEGKGMDDYIQSQGIEAFREKLIEAQLVQEKWKDVDKTDKPPLSGAIGKELAEKYNEQWRFCAELNSWLIYEHEQKGVWSVVSELIISQAILVELTNKGIEVFRTNSYVANIIGFLRDKLLVEKWVEQSERYLPFNNGVYDLTTKKLHEHSPGFNLTWKLPRDYSMIESEFPTINQFLSTMASSEHDYKLLLYFMAATLRGRADLQRFLYLIGTGGTGKSTYNDLLTLLVGENNTTTQGLEDLEDKHNIIDLFGKRLLALPDQPPVTSRKNSNFKRLTGGDYLSGRRLFKDVSNFKFNGTVLVTSNRPFIFPASTAQWLQRRMIMIECNNVVPKWQRNSRLIDAMAKELPALTHYLLNIPDKELEDVIKGVDESDLTSASWEHHCQTDGLAAWINDEIIYDPTAITRIGSNANEWKEEDYNPHFSTLYGAYCWYCKRTGRSPKTTQTFSGDLLEVTAQVLGWSVEKDRKSVNGKKQRVIKGVRLRTDLDDNYPTVEELLEGDNHKDNHKDSYGDNLVNYQKPDISSNLSNGDNRDNLKTEKDDINKETSPPTNLPSKSEPLKQVVPSCSPNPEKPMKTESEKVTTQNQQDKYKTYPSTRSDDSRHKQKRANKCKEQLLACQTKADLDAFKASGDFSENEYKWVWHNLLTGKEQARITAIAKTEQQELSWDNSSNQTESDDHIEYLKALMLNALSKESLTELKREYFSEDDIKQVWGKMTIEERAKVKAIANQ